MEITNLRHGMNIFNKLSSTLSWNEYGRTSSVMYKISVLYYLLLFLGNIEIRKHRADQSLYVYT